MSIVRLLGLSLTVPDLMRAADFYCGILGFSIASEPAPVSPALLQAMGVRGGSARSLGLRLGHQELELLAFDPAGAPYPTESTAHDLWFQHLALVVSDIGSAWNRLQAAPITPITQGAPQILPPNTGSVSAFKFRDPDLHPLELIHFPAGTGDPAWQSGPGLFLGIDHSAIVVSDIARSLTFYGRLLGLSEMSRSVNQGEEQERLDGTPGDVVDVIALKAAAETTPHLELLGYRIPPVAKVTSARSVRDVASTRCVFEVSDLAALTARLERESVQSVSFGTVSLPDGSLAATVRDPDGHFLLLLQLASVQVKEDPAKT